MTNPHRNRVSPLGDIIATPLRGAWMGNRGILHSGTGIVRFHASKLWIICALQYRGWRATQWQPGHYTVLFFHDEAVALAAGHRPCALCRRSAYAEFKAAAGVPAATAKQLDDLLHRERLVPRTHRRRLHGIAWPDLPDGAFVVQDDAPALVLRDRLLPWSAAGYGPPIPRPRRDVASVITPPSAVAALAAGYPVQIDQAATA